MSSFVGQTIRGYEIGDRIGSGGYGEVYRATQLSVKRDVAIKVILPQYASDPQFVAGFESEAQLVAQLEHPNIVPLFDYWQDSDSAFLVMRYVRGGSLKDMIDKGGALPLARTVRLIEQIGDALQAAHDAHVVHCDIKPANILIDLRGNAYLTDFGIAKQLTSNGDSDGSGVVKGTFAYMAPEQIQGETVNPQTDIYALGLMIYEMLVGKHPFHKTSVGSLLIRQMQEPLPNVRDVRDDLSPSIDNVIQMATAKAHADRYASVVDLVDDLRSAVNDISVRLPQSAAPARKKLTTIAERNRNAMLTNIRKFWLEGVLENSLHNAVVIDLGLKSESGAVDNPWDTLIQTSAGTKSLTYERIVDVFDHLNGKLLILGDPGGGKTTTLLMLARDLLHRAETDNAHPIPIALNLASWGKQRSRLVDWIVEELNRVYQVPRKVGRTWVENDELLLLLDGLDEVEEAAQTACVEAINVYRREHGFVDVVVCSRTADYEALDAQLLMNGAVVIQPLGRTQIKDYFETLGTQFAPIASMLDEDDALGELCQSPFMLSVIALAYADGRAALPTGLNVSNLRDTIFGVYVERALQKATHTTAYPPDEVRHQLSWLGRQMQAHGQSIFEIESLQPTWLGHNGTRLFGWMYTAAVVLLFAATLVTVSLLALQGEWLGTQALIITIIVYTLNGITFGFLLTRRFYDRWWMTFVYGAAGFATVIVPGVAWVDGLSRAIARASTYWVAVFILRQLHYAPDTVRTIENLRFSPSRIRYPILAIVSFIMATYAVVFMSPHTYPEYTTLTMLISGLLAAIPTAYASGLVRDTVGESERPNRGIWTSAWNGLRVGATVAVAVFITYLVASTLINGDFVGGLYIGASFAIYILVIAAFGFGFTTVLQHLVLRGLLSRREGIPWNYADFLNHAARLILLRRVGGSYTFAHRYLLEYFAALEPPEKGTTDT